MKIFKVIKNLYLQGKLRKSNISITIKHYSSGMYSFDIQKHNEDATGWTKLSGFMEKSFYTYDEALDSAIQEGTKYKNIDDNLRTNK